jgi:hypothetical protein
MRKRPPAANFASNKSKKRRQKGNREKMRSGGRWNE